MIEKNLNVLYFSPTETTKKIVKAITKGLGNGHKTIYDITLPESRETSISFCSDDILIVGVPVYGGRIPAFLHSFFSRIKGNGTLAIFVVVYGNRDYEDALLELKNGLEEKGFIGIAAGAFIGEHSNTKRVATGRPDREDLLNAKDFGKSILQKIMNQNFSEISVKGNFPYKEKKKIPPMVPNTDDRCTQCGICAQYCPMGAIDSNDAKVIDLEKCIQCSSCVKRCEEGAKSFTHEIFCKITETLIDTCSQINRKPEWFL